MFKNTDKEVRERKDFRLPAVVPIVLYNGNDNWTAARSYREYTERGDLFGDSVIDFRYILFDLSFVPALLVDVVLVLTKLTNSVHSA